MLPKVVQGSHLVLTYRGYPFEGLKSSSYPSKLWNWYLKTCVEFSENSDTVTDALQGLVFRSTRPPGPMYSHV